MLLEIQTLFSSHMFQSDEQINRNNFFIKFGTINNIS